MEKYQSPQITLLNNPKPSEICIELTVFSENDFEPSDLTNYLELTPTKSWKKGDLIRKNLYRKENHWGLSTPNIHTFDVEEVFQCLLNLLNGKSEILGNYFKNNILNVKFDIVIYMYYPDTPSIIIPNEFISLANQLGAYIEFDTYICIDSQ